jgi:hypothetical protein
VYASPTVWFRFLTTREEGEDKEDDDGGGGKEKDECFVQFALPTTQAPYQHFNCEVFFSFTIKKLDIQ